jgi:hypothetical protein
VGDSVTVRKWIGTYDRSYCGDVLEVKAIDYPFAVMEKKTGHFAGGRITLNLKEVELMKLSDEFVDAATA